MIAKPKRAKVYAEFDEDDPPTHAPVDRPFMDTESWLNFWVLAAMAIAAVGIIGYLFGWLKPPQQATLDKLEQTQQTLLGTKTELERVKSCINN